MLTRFKHSQPDALDQYLRTNFPAISNPNKTTPQQTIIMARFGGFGRRGHAGADTGTTDYGAPAGRSSRAHRLAILANHWLHWSSSIIVLGISAYFIANYSHNTHLVYWITVVSLGSSRDQLIQGH